MQATSRLEAAFTATLAAALLALGVTAFATVERDAAVPALHATLPAVTVVGKRPAPDAVAAAPAQNEGSVARKAS